MQRLPLTVLALYLLSFGAPDFSESQDSLSCHPPPPCRVGAPWPAGLTGLAVWRLSPWLTLGSWGDTQGGGYPG